MNPDTVNTISTAVSAGDAVASVVAALVSARNNKKGVERKRLHAKNEKHLDFIAQEGRQKVDNMQQQLLSVLFEEVNTVGQQLAAQSAEHSKGACAAHGGIHGSLPEAEATV